MKFPCCTQNTRTIPHLILPHYLFLREQALSLHNQTSKIIQKQQQQQRQNKSQFGVWSPNTSVEKSMCQHTFNPSSPQPFIRENTHKNPGLTRYWQYHNLKLYRNPSSQPCLKSQTRKTEHCLPSSNLQWQNGMHLGTYSTNIQPTTHLHTHILISLTPDIEENHLRKILNPKQSPFTNKLTTCPQTLASFNPRNPTRKPQRICTTQYRLRNRNRRRW